jgi:hypothetical protein
MQLEVVESLCAFSTVVEDVLERHGFAYSNRARLGIIAAATKNFNGPLQINISPTTMKLVCPSAGT